ncbi:MAG: peptidoglycan DD-metalloendopeptidase family protein, partial [Leucobacter sp.]
DAMFTEAPSMYWATGTDFADALSGAVLAGVRQAPMFVVQPTCVPTPTYEMITSKGTTRIGLIGGIGALDHRVANLLECAGSIKLNHPVPGARWGDAYGPRTPIKINGKWTSSFHNGQDFPASTGTPIRAAHAGTVIWNTWDPYGGGNGMQIGSKNYSTLYMHMREKSKLSLGSWVNAGDVIGYVGSSGSATGPHLHFMLRINGVNTNPRPYIR